jgi:hypothetical protein
LLSKWLWRLESEEDVWRDILKWKYMQKENLTQIEDKPCMSTKVKPIFKDYVQNFGFRE